MEWKKKLPEEVGKEILACAERLEIEALDTAISHGDCTKRLGSIGVKDWKIITIVLPPQYLAILLMYMTGL